MTNETTAKTILEQMGGANRISAMVGVKKFLTEENSVQFKFKGSKKYNYCKVTLDVMDTYTFELKKVVISRKTFETKISNEYALEGAYCDMIKNLFEEKTGLYLTL